MRKRYIEDLYHKPTGEVIPDWDPGGLVEDAQLLVAVGCRVAQADRYPAWSPGNEFEAIRDAKLKSTY